LLSREIRQFDGNPVEELEGTYDGNRGAAYAVDKANVSVQWTKGDFSLGYLGEYISGLDADAPFADYTQKIDYALYHDIVGSYSFSAMNSDMVFSAGITNITDEAPPYINAGFNAHTDPATYRLFGIGYYARLKWSY